MILSEDQEQVLSSADKWFYEAPEPILDYRNVAGELAKVTVGFAQDYEVCAIGGYAGTGKTTILKHVGLKYENVRFVTPTHKAAQVLRSKLPEFLQRKVVTFHSLIYHPRPVYRCEVSGLPMEVNEDEKCSCEAGEFCDHSPTFYNCDRHGIQTTPGGTANCRALEHLTFEKREYLAGWASLIVVDEASMLTEDEVNDIRSFGVPVMLVGDHGQLPPVKAQMNPWIKSPKLILTTNHRQGESSGIPDAAASARGSGVLHKERYGSSVRVLRASDNVVPDLLERFRPESYTRAVIVQYNKTRSNLNVAFHEQYGSDVLNEGERLMALQRIETAVIINPATGETEGETFIFNGTIATVRRVDQIRSRVATVVLELDTDWRGVKGVHVLMNVAIDQLASPDKLPLDKKPKHAALWDYAYAITAHKAQGSEFDQVIVMQESAGDARWLYTAVTRAKEGLIVLT